MTKEYAKLNIVKRNLSALKPHPQNPRLHPDEQKRHLAQSIKQFSYAKGSICIQKDTDYILAGHAIREQLIEKGFKEADVVELDFDKEVALAFLTADNRMAELGQWDMSRLEANLAELVDYDYSIDDMGFDDKALYELAESEADNRIIKKEEEEADKDQEEEITCPKCGHKFNNERKKETN